MSITTISEHACFGGVQGFYQHQSSVIGLPMRFAVYQPPQAQRGPPSAMVGKLPVLFYLAGLTCTDETFMIKAGAQRTAAELGVVLVSCDTSPRNTGIEGATNDWDFGEGAGFYLDATAAPWRASFRMERYLVEELRALVFANFAADANRVGIFGHSMGGHGALTLALRHPDCFHSVSAFAPICAPTECAWGEKALGNYLGPDRTSWAAHDAAMLIREGPVRFPRGILVDQGLDDKFLAQGQLRPELLEDACRASGQPLTLRRHAGYDHSYYFVSTFMADHLHFHHARLDQRTIRA